jgi:hypothetical protein
MSSASAAEECQRRRCSCGADTPVRCFCCGCCSCGCADPKIEFVIPNEVRNLLFAGDRHRPRVAMRKSGKGTAPVAPQEATMSPASAAEECWRGQCLWGAETPVRRFRRRSCLDLIALSTPAAKRRKNAAHGASRGSAAQASTKPRRGERKVCPDLLISPPCKRSCGTNSCGMFG